VPEVFGIEGGAGGPAKKPDPSKAKKPASRGEPDVLYGSMKPDAGETKAGRYVQYDNETGAIMVNLPPRFAQYKRELEEDLMEEFYGEPSGAAEGTNSLDRWIAQWIEKKEKEDPSLTRPEGNEAT
jgi:hypothetical protein